MVKMSLYGSHPHKAEDKVPRRWAKVARDSCQHQYTLAVTSGQPLALCGRQSGDPLQPTPSCFRVTCFWAPGGPATIKLQ